jgi:hypothetical protein
MDAGGGDLRRVTGFRSIATRAVVAALGDRLAFFTTRDFRPPSEDRPPPAAEISPSASTARPRSA